MTTNPRTSEVAELPRERAIRIIRERFLGAGEPGLPKHSQLRKAILSCIESGILRPGHKLPPEQVLTAELGLSLGTVRRALEQLAIGHVVVREHGHGTFIAEPPRPIDHNWHFRFFAEDGKTLLPVYSQLVARKITDARGAWTDALGKDSKGFVQIERTFDIDGRFMCCSEFFLPASRFGGFMILPPESLEAVNLKNVLANQFGATTIYVTQRARVEVLSRRICTRIGVPQRSPGLFLQLTGYTFGDVPISYHEVWVPATPTMMDLAPVWATEPKN